MAYDREKTFELIKTKIVEHNLLFVEDVTGFVAISKTTLYDFFPVDSNEMNEIKALLNNNRVAMKTSMRDKWFKSEHPTLQVALMKIIATDEEAHRLNGTKTENLNKNLNTPLIIDLTGNGEDNTNEEASGSLQSDTE